MSKVFITGGNEGYLPLIEVLVKSIKPYLTESSFIVYTFDCDYKIEGVETRRINLPKFNFPPQGKYYNLAWKDNTLYWAKYYATLDAFNDYEYVSWLDGDAFVTEHINEIWDYIPSCDLNPQPLFMHYYNSDMNIWRHDCGVEIKGKYGGEAAYIFETERNPYEQIIAAGIYLANRKHIDFFKGCLDLWYQTHQIGCYTFVDNNALSEERLTNVYTWKNKTRGFLPITWMNYWSEEKETYFKDKKLTCFLRKENDVMFNKNTGNALMVHAPKDVEDLENLYSAYNQTPNKLMIVAHPDDEIIFGGTALIDDKNWKVICLTNKRDDVRRMEFEKSMRDLQVPEFEVYDLEDNFTEQFPENDLNNILQYELNLKDWDKVVTHNNIGEYGHTHHKQVHDVVKNNLVDKSKLWVFDKDINYNNQDTIDLKTRIFYYRYESQQGIYEQIKNMSGSWFTDKDMTTNYVEHGVIKPYNESSYKDDEFIHCTLK